MSWAEMRFAIYFTPRRTSQIAEFGRRWLGRDAKAGSFLPGIPVDGFSAERIAALTAAPAHYGWHATLKAPFRLAEGQAPGDLVARLYAFAGARLAFEIPFLRLTSLDGFLALTPNQTPSLLTGLAIDCVRAFEEFRAPLSSKELARWSERRLTPRQRELLARWGYPYVMEEFRFHITLTGRMEPGERHSLMAALSPSIARICRRPLAIDAVTLCAQVSRREPFREIRRFTFEGI